MSRQEGERGIAQGKELATLRQELESSLGDSFPRYLNALQYYFTLKVPTLSSKVDIELQLEFQDYRRTEAAVEIHNRFMVGILREANNQKYCLASESRNAASTSSPENAASSEVLPNMAWNLFGEKELDNSWLAKPNTITLQYEASATAGGLSDAEMQAMELDVANEENAPPTQRG